MAKFSYSSLAVHLPGELIRTHGNDDTFLTFIPDSDCVRELGENDLRWFAARLLIAIEDTRRFGGMSVHELKQALKAIPGVESLTLGYAPNGDELVTIAGRTVTVRPGASNAEIAFAFESGSDTSNVTATPLPPVTYSPTQIRTKSMSNPIPGSFAASLRAMMDEARAGIVQARADGVAKVGEAVKKLGEAKDATAHVAGNMAASIESEAADVMAELGQISNDLGQ